MIACTDLPRNPGKPDLLWLSALLAGLGKHARSAAEDLRAGMTACSGKRMCVDGGASVLFALRAPGRRIWEAHVRLSEPGSVQTWSGVQIDCRGERTAMHRTMYPAVDPDAVSHATRMASEGGIISRARFDTLHRTLGPYSRIYSVGRSIDDCGGARIAWQIDRHAPATEIVARLVGLGACSAVRASLANVLGFDLGMTTGPWSVSASVAAPELGFRIGTTRWAWAVEDQGKRDRLAAWISAHGGDGAYAAGLHDLLAHAPRVARTVGRAIEIDVIDHQVVGVTAYLSADLRFSQQPAVSGHCKEW